ncbi:MAG: hypothetical protein PGN16_01765 [Sphingomonas phyllosphaerae]|uniref:hypothetical protein n=1 Tax=Sphingomonas phyllosphaerae TaxID=257003 RepID=UPI002FF5A6EE
MRALFPFLACLMLVLTGWSGVAHAREIVGSVEASSSEMFAHVDGDGDQVPADAEKGYPHHHASCHGHDVGTPLSDRMTAPVKIAGNSFGVRVFPAIASHDGEQALRPPQA